MTFLCQKSCKLRGISLNRVIFHEVTHHISALHQHIHTGHINKASHVLILHTGFLILSDDLISVLVEAVFPLIVIFHPPRLELEMDLLFRVQPAFQKGIGSKHESHGTENADHHECITLESTKDGLHVYDNPAGVLTNNPPFPMQLFALNNYMQLSPKATGNHFAPNLPLNAYSRGMGAMGLPGDLSSQSRFVRAAFVRANSRSGESEAESVSQFFHILGSVEQQRGCCELDNGKYEITLYTSCCNADKGIYYYTTYENSQITAVDMHKEDMDGTELVSYPLVEEQQIRWMK